MVADVMTRADVEAARERISGRVRRTPLIAVDDAFGGIGWFKLEYLQHTGTFKVRGAFNRIISAAEEGSLNPEIGVVVASGGNAGMANAFAARALGVPATVFVPSNAPAVKVDKLRTYGADVVLGGSEYAEAYLAAIDYAEATGAVYCHAYDQPAIVAGAGTLGLEILDDLAGEIDTVVVAVGGGGLMAGVAVATEGVAGVVGVEPVTIPTLSNALAEGVPIDVSVSGVAADALGARQIGDIAFSVATRMDVRSALVSESAIVQARARLWDEYRIIVEHGAATALAALTTGAYQPGERERFAVVLCGANTDPASL